MLIFMHILKILEPTILPIGPNANTTIGKPIKNTHNGANTLLNNPGITL